MKNTLVFGASLKPKRYSHIAIKRLLANGLETYAFGLKAGDVNTVQIKTNLSEIPKIHTVTLYLNPERQKQYYKDIINLRPKRVIFNPCTENPEFYELLNTAEIQVEVACTLVLLATKQY